MSTTIVSSSLLTRIATVGGQADHEAAGDGKAIYRDTDPRLHGAAGLSVLAHLEDLVARGLVATEGDPAIDGVFVP
jgi:hypothetical protein